MTALAAAPNFNLNHIVGHPVALSNYRGNQVVLVFSGRDSTDQARQISRAIRSHHDSEALPIISILDLSGVPKMMHGFAKGRIQSGYQGVVRDATAMMQQQGKQSPADPSRIIIMLPDWDSAVTTSYGLKDVDKQAIAVAVDGDGNIRGYGSGPQGGEQIIALFS